MNIKRLICYLFGHKYKLIKKINEDTKHVGCKRCDAEFSLSYSMKCILPMDDEFREFHTILENLEKERVELEENKRMLREQASLLDKISEKYMDRFMMINRICRLSNQTDKNKKFYTLKNKIKKCTR